MPTYSAAAVSNAAIAFRKPITLQQGRALRDNPLAVFEGAAGAPRILGMAAASDRFGGLPVLTVTASDAYTVMQGHGYVQGPGSPVLATYTINAYTGSMRFRATHSTGVAEYSALRIYKNGGLVAEWGIPASQSANRFADIAVVPGDVIRWDHTGTTGAATIVGVFASNAYQPISLYAPAVIP